jgi:hypothetical protein
MQVKRVAAALVNAVVRKYPPSGALLSSILPCKMAAANFRLASVRML